MGKYQFIALGVILVVSLIIVQSAYASSTFTNNVGGIDGSDSQGITDLDISDTASVDAIIGETYFDNSTNTMHFIWIDDIADPTDDEVYYSNSQDGITRTTPFLLYTGGGGSFPQVVRAEVFSSGNDVFVTWLLQESATTFSLLQKYSADNGATFSALWTPFGTSVGVSATSSMEMVGNSLDDVVVIFRNSTSDTLESRVSHNNGLTWTNGTLSGDNHGSGNGDGFQNFDDHSITMTGNQIDITFTADYTGGGGGCAGVDCNSVFHQQSTDAGDTWKADPLLLNDGLVDHSDEEPFIFVSETGGSGVINVVYLDEDDTGQFQHARSTNGGTSFSIEIDTGLRAGGCANFTQPFLDFTAIGSDNKIVIFCVDGTNGLDFVTSENGGSSWSSIGTIATGSETPSNLKGYTNGTASIISFEATQANEFHIASNEGGNFTNWYPTRDLFRDPNSGLPLLETQIGITDDRVIIPMQDPDVIEEFVSLSFEFPVCLTDPTFNCPLDISANSDATQEPTNVAGVATTTGYHSIWQKTAVDPRIFYSSTTDAESATTPIDISGQMLNAGNGLGSIQTDLHIFEDGAGTIDAFWIEDHAQDFPPFLSLNEAFHARSTDGGATFGTKVGIETGQLNIIDIEPVVDGSDLAVAYLNGTALGDAVPFFVQSSDGGTSWGTPINIESGATECDTGVANGHLRLLKESGNFYSAWTGINSTSSLQGTCFNLSTDGGSTWGSVQGIDDAQIDNSLQVPFELFANDTDVTVVWTNLLANGIQQARSTNSGTSFGAEEDVLDTTTESCSDPTFLARVIEENGSIYLICEGGGGTFFKSSTNMGSTYSALSTISTSITDNWDAIANVATVATNIVVVGDTPNTGVGNLVFFSDDSGATWSESNTIFQNFINHDVITGNATDTFIGFVHETLFDLANNAYVSLGTFAEAPDVTAPVITILGDNPVQHLVNTAYTDAGATALDDVDGDITANIVTVSNVDTSIVATYQVTYNVSDTAGNPATEAVRTVQVVTQVTTGAGGGVPSAGSPIGDVPEPEFPQEEFDQALADALAQIELSNITPLEVLVQTFFEFTVVDVVHEDVAPQSFLSNERLGFRWSSDDDIVLVSAITAPSPFLITFEQLPAVKQGSGLAVSTDFIVYDLEVPRNLCTDVITMDCVEKLRYEVPVTLNAIINEIQVSDTGTITVDLTEELIDPILLILLATFSIPVIGVIIQRARGRSVINATRRTFS